jgi:hypothetical protein
MASTMLLEQIHYLRDKRATLGLVVNESGVDEANLLRDYVHEINERTCLVIEKLKRIMTTDNSYKLKNES